MAAAILAPVGPVRRAHPNEVGGPWMGGVGKEEAFAHSALVGDACNPATR